MSGSVRQVTYRSSPATVHSLLRRAIQFRQTISDHFLYAALTLWRAGLGEQVQRAVDSSVVIALVCAVSPAGVATRISAVKPASRASDAHR